MPRARLLRLILWIALSSALIGAFYARALHLTSDDPAFLTYLHGGLVGGLTGGFFATVEILAQGGTSGTRFRRLPFLAYLGLRSLFYLAGILVIQAVVNRLLPDASGRFSTITQFDIFFSLALSVVYNLLLGVDALLGPGVLVAFVAGRYYQPRIEERALLFVDMRGSSAIAERLGEVRFLAFLNRFIVDLSLAIAQDGGEIHKYVGDEVIATWRLVSGAGNAPRCLHACFAALDRLEAGAAAYEREFGARADFRASLHCGPVAVGELGFLKKEIALIGDAMNTAARILDACRETGRPVLASAALLDRLAGLPDGVVRRPLGLLAMRGKEQAVELFAMETSQAREWRSGFPGDRGGAPVLVARGAQSGRKAPAETNRSTRNRRS
jgi:adenylate cyclase